MDKQEKMPLYKPIVVSIIVAILIWFLTDGCPLAGTRDAYITCEAGHTSIIFFTWLILISAMMASRKRVMTRTTTAPNTTMAVSKKHQWAGFLFCTVPLLLIALSWLGPSVGYMAILQVGVMVIGWISIIPAFVYGIILLRSQ